MTSIFSAISGQFGRAVIIGALLPAAIFVLGAYVFIIPMLPWEWPLITRIATLDAQWKIASLLVAATIIAGMLFVLNTSITRFYEGYPWEDGWIGEWRKRVHRARLDAQTGTRDDGRELARRLRRKNSKDARLNDLAKARDDADREIHKRYPARRSVLPSRLGNTIRAFETYSREQYGISAIPLWPRFVARIRPEHAAAIDDAKTSFDVSIHLSFLGMVTAVAMLAIGAAYPLPFASTHLLVWFIIRVAISIGLVWAFYELAIDRAVAWGDLVRGVFDLYRWEVLKDLGYETRPGDMESERALWTAISQQMIFGDPDLGPMLHYNPSSLVVPANPWVAITRAVRTVGPVRQIVLGVENRGVDPALKVRIAQNLPSGNVYVYGSARLNGKALGEVSGANPYFFTIGALAPSGRAELSYEFTALEPPPGP